MSQQQRKPLTQNVTISQILRAYGKQFRQITGRYSDGHNGRCTMGVVLSYFGWDGKLDYISTSLQTALPTLSNADLRDDFSIIELNDSGMTFDEIADSLDRISNSRFDDLDHSYGLGETLYNHIIALVSALILLLLCETMAAVAQQSPLNDRIDQNNSELTSLKLANVKSKPDDKHIIVTWLKSNETETDDNTSVLNVSRQDFWKMFDQLFRYTR